MVALMYFGERGECPECGREIAIRAGVLVYHRDVDGDGLPCEGRGKKPKEPTYTMGGFTVKPGI